MINETLDNIFVGFGNLSKGPLTWESIDKYVRLFNQAKEYFKDEGAFDSFLENTLPGGRAYAERIIAISKNMDTLKKRNITPQQAIVCLDAGLPETSEKSDKQITIKTDYPSERPTHFHVEVTPQYLMRKIKLLVDKPFTINVFDEQIKLIDELEAILGSKKALMDFFNEQFPLFGIKYAEALRYMATHSLKDMELLREKDEVDQIDGLERYFSAYMRVYGSK